MKKFFSLFVTAAVALFGLTCCGGGGEEDGNRNYMSAKDFAVGAKKIRTGYQLRADLIPSGNAGESYVSDTKAESIPGRIVAGNADIPVDFTYEITDEEGEHAILNFSVVDSYKDLADPDLMSALGFAVEADADGAGGGTSIINQWDSLSGLRVVMIFDYTANIMQVQGTYMGQAVNEEGQKTGVPRQYTVTNDMVPFIVLPR